MSMWSFIGDNNFYAAQDALDAFKAAGKAMRKAQAAQLAFNNSQQDPRVRRHYGKLHKQMVRLCRAWNRLEQERDDMGIWQLTHDEPFDYGKVQKRDPVMPQPVARQGPEFSTDDHNKPSEGMALFISRGFNVVKSTYRNGAWAEEPVCPRCFRPLSSGGDADGEQSQ